MALKTFVKISAVSNLSDARYCAGMGVDIIGFDLENPEITPEKFIDITSWISGVKLAGEFFRLDPVDIKLKSEQYQLDYIQISQPELVQSVKQIIDLPLILELDISDDLTGIMAETTTETDIYLIKAANEQDCEKQLEKAISLSQLYPILLGCGVSSENLNKLLYQSKLKGIALKGSEEIKPGFKDFDELADILELLEIEG